MLSMRRHIVLGVLFAGLPLLAQTATYAVFTGYERGVKVLRDVFGRTRSTPILATVHLPIVPSDTSADTRKTCSSGDVATPSKRSP